MKVLNPFSVRLEKQNPFYEITGDPLYKNGHFSVYKYADWFVYLYKNIIISERTGFNKDLVDRYANNDEPKDYSKFNFRRSLDALKDGKKFARKIGFKIR